MCAMATWRRRFVASSGISNRQSFLAALGASSEMLFEDALYLDALEAERGVVPHGGQTHVHRLEVALAAVLCNPYKQEEQ
jgi:hypothetical protein